MLDYKIAREVVVTNQADMDAIPIDYNGRIFVKAGQKIIISKINLYKAVHKIDGRYVSDKQGSFEYIIGAETVADGLTIDQKEDCGHGIHAAHVGWCLDYGKYWPDLAILEVEMDMDGLVVPLNGSGKVRAAKCRVIREAPLEECGLYGKILAKRRSTQKS